MVVLFVDFGIFAFKRIDICGLPTSNGKTLQLACPFDILVFLRLKNYSAGFVKQVWLLEITLKIYAFCLEKSWFS